MITESTEFQKAFVGLLQAMVDEDKAKGDGSGGPGLMNPPPITPDGNGASGQWEDLKGQLGSMARTTNPIPPNANDLPQSQIEEDRGNVLNKVPFTLSAHDSLMRANIRPYHMQDDNGSSELKEGRTPLGDYTPAGAGFQNFLNRHLRPISDKATDYILNNTNFLQTLDKEHIDLSNTDPETLTHEMLHQLFEQTPMGSRRTDLSQNPEAENFGGQFLDTWDKVSAGADQDSPLPMIDKHLDTNYDLANMAGEDVATERYAYLGELVLRYGLGVIPKELRPYYSSVFDFKKGSAK